MVEPVSSNSVSTDLTDGSPATAGAAASPGASVSLEVSDAPAGATTADEGTVLPAGVGSSTLYVPDPTAIPDEPPEELLYHHKVAMWESVKEVWRHREIVQTLAERDFKAQYKQATLGVLWAVVAPLSTLFVLIIVFSRVKRFHTGGVPFALYAFVGILCWSFFASSLGGGGNSLLSNKALLSKTQFPRECFPLETMVVCAINTLFSLVPLAILFVVFGRAPALTTLWVPLFLLVEIVFAIGVTLGAAGLIIQARDLTQVLPIIISLGIFATPVIWPFTLIPTHYHVTGGHLVRHLYHGHLGAGHWVGGFYVNLQAIYGFFNPVGPVIANVRLTMLQGQSPNWIPMITAAVGAMIYLFFGYRIFKRFEVNFADIA
jgi:ABC-2 type transport system permease protein/lipopolysaccharide transport system permease protein